MRQKSGKLKEPAEKVVKDIRRATRKRHSSEEKIRAAATQHWAGKALSPSNRRRLKRALGAAQKAEQVPVMVHGIFWPIPSKPGWRRETKSRVCTVPLIETARLDLVSSFQAVSAAEL